MKLYITENKLESVIFKYFDRIFKDWFVQETREWYGISTPKYELLIGYRKDDPKIGYYWGEPIGIGSGPNLFGVSREEFINYLHKYIELKFNLKFESLV